MKGFDFGENNMADKEYQPVSLEDENLEYSVTSPVMHSGHIVYNVRGSDNKGVWEGNRRYSEFYILH